MSVLSLLLLFIIVYFCAKAIGSIWRDAFGTIGDEQHSRQQTTSRRQQTSSRQQSTNKKDRYGEQPIGKDEGEYIDYEEL